MERIEKEKREGITFKKKKLRVPLTINDIRVLAKYESAKLVK